MPNGRRQIAIWGLSVALLAAALLSATALTGAENGLTTRVVGSVLAAAFLTVSIGCLGLAGRGMIRSALTGMGSRLQKQTEALNAAQDRRHAELLAKVAFAEEHSLSTLRKIRVDLRAIAATTELCRTGQEEAAVNGRNFTSSLENMVRQERMRSREDIVQFTRELQKTTGRLDEIERGQRRTLNFLRREGNIQIVLDRLQATERRLLTSVESGALTLTEQISDPTGRNLAELRNDMRSVLKGMELVHEGITNTKQEIEASTPRTEELLAEARGILQSMDGSLASIAEMEDSNAIALRQMEGSMQAVPRLREDFRAVIENVLDSREGTEQLVSAIRTDINDLRLRWDGLQQAWRKGSVEPSMEFKNSETKTAADVAPEVRTLVQLTNILKNDVKSLHRHVDRTGVETVRQTEALMQLLPRMSDASRRFPASGGFAMAPDGLLLLSDLIADYKPKRILEIGSGTSTIWIGCFAASIASSVISIDHLDEYRARTQNDLLAFGLEETVDLRLAELAPLEIEAEMKTWYDLNALKDLSSIDMVVIDGPPESTGTAARSPAFPLLRSKLSDRALLVVDDLHRDQESQMVEDWIAFDHDLKKTTWEAGRTAVLEYRRGR